MGDVFWKSFPEGWYYTSNGYEIGPFSSKYQAALAQQKRPTQAAYEPRETEEQAYRREMQRRGRDE